MSLQRNYYEVLGLPPGATTDQIKKKYRELARKFHPDVVEDKTLGQRVFSQINQAYSVLGNPERRAQYNGTLQNAALDASRAAAPKMEAAKTEAAKPEAPKAAASVQASVPPKAAAPRPEAPTAAAPKAVAPQAAPSRPAAAPKSPAFTEMLSRAENAIMAGKPVEARAFCVRILEADPNHARALELLGDALALMGRSEEAAVQYRRALQAAPSTMIQTKLSRIESSGIAASGAATRTLPPHQAPPAKSGGQKTQPPSGGNAPEEADKPGLLGRLLGRK